MFFVVIFFIFNISKKNEQKISKKRVSSEGTKKLTPSKKQENDNDTVHKAPSSITFFKEEEHLDKDVLSSPERNTFGDKEKTIETIAGKQYSTTEEVLDSLFPNLKERIGQGKYDMLIESFPFCYMELIPSKITTTQKEKYDKLLSSLRVELQINIPSYQLTLEEINKIMNKIHRNYIPEFINLFTDQQQKEFAGFIEEDIPNWK